MVLENSDSTDLDINHTRVIVETIVLHNFKSYAGTEIIGPFDPTFSAIVGPNGSGKSNIIDALLFVFGFRASKMRQGKLSGLIHVSKACPNLSEAFVQVNFIEVADKKTGIQNLEDTRFSVKRSVYKNNTSKYYINSELRSFNEVSTFLKSKQIDLDQKRFLILQGEVELISQMKPKGANENEEGLLEYLEDIVGTSQYKPLIEKTCEELELLNDQRLEKLNRLNFLEKEKNGLEDQRNEAIDYIRQEQDLNKKKLTLNLIKKEELDKKLSNLESKIIQIQEEYKQKSTEYENYQSKYSEHINKIKDNDKKIEENAYILKNYEKKHESISKNNIKMQENMRFMKNKLKKITKSIETENMRTSEAKFNIKAEESNKEKFKKDMETLIIQNKKESEILDSISKELEGKTLPIQKQIDDNLKQLVPWDDKISKVNSSIKLIESEIELINDKNNSESNRKENLFKSIEKYNTEKLVTEQNIKAKKEMLETTKHKINQLNNEIKEMDVNYAYKTLNEIKAKHYSLLQNYENMKNQNKLLSSLLKMKKEGKLKGIHGRLGNLGVIDKKYATAITMACPQLNNIVVESVVDAQNCINYLRDYNLGRAIFLCMDQIHNINQKKLNVPCPQGSERLFHLITPKDDAYKKLFYYAVKDTIVVENLSLANKVAFGTHRWRVVTLQGQLIDQSGTMSGGGGKVSRNGMCSEFSQDDFINESELKTSELELKKAQESFDSKNQKQSLCLKNIRDTNEIEIPQIETEIIKLEMELKNFDKLIFEVETQIKNIKYNPSKTNKDSQKEKDLNSRLKIHKQELDSYMEEKNGIENLVSKLKDKILDMGGTKFRTQNTKSELVRERIKLLETNLEKCDLSIIKGEKNLNNIFETLDELEKSRKKILNETEILETKIKESSSELEDISKEKRNIEDEIDNLNETKHNLTSQVESLKEHIHQFQVLKLNHQNNLNDFSTESSKIKSHLKSLNKTIEDLQNSIDGEYVFQGKADVLALDAEIHHLEKKLEGNKPNLSVIDEYSKKEEEYKISKNDIEKHSKIRDSTQNELERIRSLRLNTFNEGFQRISYKLKEIYQLITGEGLAELEFVDSLDPFTEGITLSVMPPKKTWKIISHLSGGEKTLSSLALVFALHQFKPTPIYIMDEIDAALDYKNVSVIAKIIESKRIITDHEAQFIVVSLRNNMIELSKRLVGIYKYKDPALNEFITKSVVLNNN